MIPLLLLLFSSSPLLILPHHSSEEDDLIERLEYNVYTILVYYNLKII